MATRNRGLALVAVLWLVAALSMIATGMTQTIRSEARMTSRMRDVQLASALGESAMQLALQAMVAAGKRPDKLLREQIAYGGGTIDVQAMPLNGYIDINKAPVELIRQLLHTAGELPADQAESLAHSVVERRTTSGPSGKPDIFEAPEDLLRVPGWDYPLYAKIAGLITTDAQGSGRVNPLAAPSQVLRVLAAGNDAAVAAFMAGRDAEQVGIDESALNAAWLEKTPTDAVELSALVALPDGGAVRVIRRYMVGARNEDGLPWRVFYAGSFFDLPAVAGQ